MPIMIALLVILWQEPQPPTDLSAFVVPPLPVLVDDGRFVDAAGHVCHVENISAFIAAMPASYTILPNVFCFSAAGLAWARQDAGWAAWIAANDPEAVPFPDR